ncbi:PREDICTED: acid-sensing ion channel 5-like [Amphimedon queenslandica]|uniref:Uncharacterized protein n=1 Tax=Amphimedon queenslandica TaxID=400682 RepID=A0A1X7T5Z9_AMPQE|nr:PREDICTED: acid-sensing ion channel 5-like [Amphimedon queenslandica]|eukprot:XP_011408196.1 PREDICTED: acid-sensing ion channel 5-like [Amphimedon queenslandica]
MAEDSHSKSSEEKTVKCHLHDRYLKEFLDDNTIGGINHIFRGRSKVRRLLWALIFIGSIVACITLISISFQTFLEKPTASTITVITQDDEGVSFPSVTICNLNLERNESDMVADTGYLLMNHIFNPDENFHLTGLNSSFLLNSCNAISDSFPASFRNTTLWNSQHPQETLDKLIHFCGFVSGINSAVIPCKDAFKPVLTSAGICYTFNGSNNRIHSTGVRYGLKLILNIQQEERPSFNGKSGVKLIVHDGRDIARPNLYGIDVAPAHAVDVGVRRKASKDETNEADCIDSKELPFFSEYRYSQFACRQNAIVENLATSCDCSIHPDRPSSGPYSSTPHCTFDKGCCVLEQYQTFNPELACPLPCYFPYYEHTASYSSFPNGRYLNYLVEETNMSVDYIKDNFLSINVFVDDLQLTTTITKYTFGVAELLGEIGGQMGLFLGISIISIVEVVVLFLDELKRLFCTKKMREKMQDIENAIELPEIEGTDVEEDIDNKV